MRLFKSFFSLLFIFFLLLGSGCSIYKSPDRKDFESVVAGVKVQNLKALGCASESIREYSTESELVYTRNTTSPSETVFLWEYKINNQSFIESDNSEGVYCLYENI